MKLARWWVTFVALAAGASLAGQTAGKPDPWADLRFLVGSWEAKATGGKAQAQAAGTYSFRLELRDHVLARHSSYASCKGPEDFNCEHGDLLYIYPEGPGLRAIYFDNEGHVIHYAVTVARAGRAELLSDRSLPGPQFRLTYERKGDQLAGKFEIRMPGQEDFSAYLEWVGGRAGGGESP
jgi:hypothetical protein